MAPWVNVPLVVLPSHDAARDLAIDGDGNPNIISQGRRWFDDKATPVSKACRKDRIGVASKLAIGRLNDLVCASKEHGGNREK
jgi:hypothetical protein